MGSSPTCCWWLEVNHFMRRVSLKRVKSLYRCRRRRNFRFDRRFQHRSPPRWKCQTAKRSIGGARMCQAPRHEDAAPQWWDTGNLTRPTVALHRRSRTRSRSPVYRPEGRRDRSHFGLSPEIYPGIRFGVPPEDHLSIPAIVRSPIAYRPTFALPKGFPHRAELSARNSCLKQPEASERRWMYRSEIRAPLE